MKTLACITTSWDDGHPLDIRLAERLAYYGLPATFYIPFGSQRPVLGHTQIRELAASFEIGAHTMSHADLRTLSRERARREILDSRHYIEDVTGAKCAVFAPPGGKFGPCHQTMVCEAGFTGMRTVELMSLERPLQRQGLAMLKTSLQFYPHDANAYLRNAIRRLQPGNCFVYLKNAYGQTLERATCSLLDKAETEGGVFHLWGHSWELEARGLWPSLEKTLQLLRGRASKFRLVSNGALCQEVLSE